MSPADGIATATRSPADGAAPTNPLREGLESNRITDPCNVVFFGASGDLANRMLFPAMYNLRLGDIMPTNFGIIGFSRTPETDDSFRDNVHKSLDTFSRSGPARDPLWSDFAKHLSYVTGDFDDPECYRKLGKQLDENDEQFGTGGNRLYYLSTPPQVFPKIVAGLDAAGLGPRQQKKGWTRIIVEKPFGTDLDTARALQTEITKVFDEQHVYRIDHYLGKEPVQDIMALRFANIIFEPLWNRRYVDCVQITAAETVGVELRGGYYDHAGALRDMIQNHVMNLLALVAMEPPVSASADSIRDEKFKVLSALRPIAAEDVAKTTARGQYGPGVIAGKDVPGYRTEPDVDPNSNTETYAAVRFAIDNWRWADVPFYLRSGKRLARKNSEIAVRFRALPHRLFGEAGDAIEQNTLVMKIEPDEGVQLRFNAKVPGPKMHIRAVTMDFNYGSGFGVVSAPAYERLIGDAMRGDATLFTRWDAVERAWEIVMPILEGWRDTPATDFPNYAAGSQGPASSDALLAAEGREWRRI
jgi:glucose-6-phosphate 1-dehydrogenase